MQKISTPLVVVAAALLGSDGRVLLQRRHRDAQHGGLWEFPGGKVEAGESTAGALIRELEEELGVAVYATQLRPLTFASDPAPPEEGGRSLVILLYSCAAWAGEPECRDGEEIRWFAADELPALSMPPLDYPLAAALIASLSISAK